MPLFLKETNYVFFIFALKVQIFEHRKLLKDAYRFPHEFKEIENISYLRNCSPSDFTIVVVLTAIYMADRYIIL